MTREEAIEVLKKNRPGADPRRCGQELCTAVDMAIAALREQPKKISVKERLPDAFVDVLAYREIGRVEINYMLTTGVWRYGSVCANPVTHWIPLPETPTKGD